ncbi:MAG: penicillin-binding transpeptidase domain-containing protein, partial [Nocardioidaceae bacterium]
YTACNGDVPAEWPVSNSTGAGGYPMSIALPQSVNTYFAQLERLVGLCRTTTMARNLGLDFPQFQEVGPFTLGVVDVSPLDMAAAYAAFPARGMYCTPLPVSRILDRDGETLVEYEPECERVMPKAAADSMNQMLSYVQSPSGFGASLMLDQPSAAKTGTTTSNYAVWYMGYTPNLVTSSMLAGANDSGTQRTLVGVPLRGVPLSFDEIGGSSLAGPMWYEAMRLIQKWLPNRSFRTPGALGPTPGDTPYAPPPETDDDGGDNGNDNGGDDNGNNNGNNGGNDNGNNGNGLGPLQGPRGNR